LDEMSTPESKVRDPVVRWAKANGFLHVRMAFRPGVRQGVPDDLFITPNGRHCWVEFKRPGKRPTLLQNARLDAMRDRRVAAFWSADSDAAIEMLSRLLEDSK
jgi:hypothetical protein